MHRGVNPLGNLFQGQFDSLFRLWHEPVAHDNPNASIPAEDGFVGVGVEGAADFSALG